MTLKKTLMPVIATCLASGGAYAGSGCDPALTAALHDCVRIVDSLRVDKAGQARVFASDGSEFTAGQALWMKGQLRAVDRACAEGDQAEAARRLAGVQELLKEHHRSE
jgi:hypothetical protein